MRKQAGEADGASYLHLQGRAPFKNRSSHSSDCSWASAMNGTNRDRGTPHDVAPPTPPYVRVRIRRFDELLGLLGAREGSPSAANEAFGSAMVRAGLLLILHGPCGHPAVWAARSAPTPWAISSANLVRPHRQCFQAMARNRRLVHCSSSRNVDGVSQNAK